MTKETVKLYNQSNDIRWYAGEVKPQFIGVGASNRDQFEPTDTSNGVCYGLTIWWIIKKANNKDFWSWMPGPGPQVTQIKSLFRDQRGDYDFTRFEVASRKIETETNMRQQCQILMNQGSELRHEGYYYISMRGKFGRTDKVSGHAIALHLTPGGGGYFDPNFGEFSCGSIRETLTEFSKLVRSYNVRDLTVYWCCWK